jgi:hypothetical protein
VRLLVAGRGDEEEAVEDLAPEVRAAVTFLGVVSEVDKARLLRTVDAYVAPNLGGESFGIVLVEAMAAGAPVVASDLDAFGRVLDGGRVGVTFPTGDTSRWRPRCCSCSTTRRGGPPCRAAAAVGPPVRLGDRGRRAAGGVRDGRRRRRSGRRGLGPALAGPVAPMTTLVVIAVLLVLVGWYLTFSATRLDRLHARLEGARSALDAQLVRRASVSLQIAVSGRLDPASGLLLADAAHEARDSGGADREQAESDLSRALHADLR